MVEIKEALAALEFLRNYQGLTSQAHSNAWNGLTDFLQSVAQEREDWRAIEAWVNVGSMHRDWNLANTPRGNAECTLYDTAEEDGREFDGATRAEALSAAAAWARAEMAK